VTASFVAAYSLQASFDDPATGLRGSAGASSGLLGVDGVGNMGTTALGPSFSIQSGAMFNESIVFQIFQSDGVSLGAAEGATDVVLFVNGAGTTVFSLSAQDKDGGDLGTVATTIGNRTVDVSALLPGEIHTLTVEATGAGVILTGIDYTNVCLGYTPTP
jgi:hypothetical protein